MGKDREHDSNPDPITDEPGAHPAGVYRGAMGGAAIGAAIGTAVGGPVGAIVGGAAGAAAGGLVGKGIAEKVNPTEEERYWRENYKKRPYYQSSRDYDHYGPAYQYGWESACRTEYCERRFEDVESDLAENWTRYRGAARTEWKDVRDATRDAFGRVQSRARSK